MQSGFALQPVGMKRATKWFFCSTISHLSNAFWNKATGEPHWWHSSAIRRPRHGKIALTDIVRTLALTKVGRQVRITGSCISHVLRAVIKIALRDAVVSNTTDSVTHDRQIHPMPVAVEGLIGQCRQVRLGVVPNINAGQVSVVETDHRRVSPHEIAHGLLITQLITRVFFVVAAVSRAVS